MTVNTYDFRVVGPVDGSNALSTSGTSVQDSAVVSGTDASIAIGDPVVYANGYWAKVANGGGASAGLYGVAASASTETSGADGLVTVKYHPTGLVVRGAPTTAGNLAQPILGDLVTFDVADGTVTIDEDDPNGVLRVREYNSTDGTIDVVLPYNTTPA